MVLIKLEFDTFLKDNFLYGVQQLWVAAGATESFCDNWSSLVFGKTFIVLARRLSYMLYAHEYQLEIRKKTVYNNSKYYMLKRFIIPLN